MEIGVIILFFLIKTALQDDGDVIATQSFSVHHQEMINGMSWSHIWNHRIRDFKRNGSRVYKGVEPQY